MELSNNRNATIDEENTITTSVVVASCTLNDSADMSNQSEVRNEQTIKKDEKSIVTETKEEMNAKNVDEYSFEIIEKKHRNEFNGPTKTVTPSQSDTSIMLGDDDSLTTPNENIESIIATTTTTTGDGGSIIIPLSQSNEKSNQTILLEKMEIRGDNRIDEQKTYENLFTESSSSSEEEICSSNKGDTGNCNVKGRGNEFVDGMEAELNVTRENVKDFGRETNCDL